MLRKRFQHRSNNTHTTRHEIMANEQNLKPVTTHEEAVERGRKGGQKESLSKKISKRKYCNHHCPIWPCVFQPLSMNKYGGICALNKQSETIKHKYYKLMEGDESSLNKMLFQELILVQDPKDFIKYGCMVHKVKFGEKNKTEFTMKKDLTQEFVDKMKELENYENDVKDVKDEKDDGVKNE